MNHWLHCWCRCFQILEKRQKRKQRVKNGTYSLGLSTVPYTATAVYFTVSIRFRAVPFCSRICMHKNAWRYGTVPYTAVIRCTGQFNIYNLATNKRRMSNLISKHITSSCMSKSKLLLHQHQCSNRICFEACTAERNCITASWKNLFHSNGRSWNICKRLNSRKNILETHQELRACPLRNEKD